MSRSVLTALTLLFLTFTLVGALRAKELANGANLNRETSVEAAWKSLDTAVGLGHSESRSDASSEEDDFSLGSMIEGERNEAAGSEHASDGLCVAGFGELSLSACERCLQRCGATGGICLGAPDWCACF
jgi:hypothetical protein